MSRSYGSNKWLFALFTFSYLLFELGFNARLLDVAGGKPDQDALSSIEVFGRMLSGVGCTLLFWRFVVNSETSSLAAIWRLIMIGVVVVPSVYFAQKLLIDHLVNSTKPDDRATAALSAQLPSALLWDAVSIKGLDLSPQIWKKAEGKTFLAVLPLLAYTSPELIDSVEKQLPTLVSSMVKQRTGSPEAAYNAHYVPVVNEIRSRFSSDYSSASQKIEQASAQQDNPDALWEEYMQELNKQPFTEQSVTPAQRAAVIRRLHNRGLNVLNNWNIYDRAGFNAALPSGQVQAKFRSEMDTLMGRPTTIPSGLTWAQFGHHPDTQGYVRTKLHASMPIIELGAQQISLDANIEEFKTSFFHPQIKRMVDKEVARIKQPSSSYGVGMPNYEFGIQSMRAVIVPPLALSFSLFFSLCNIAGLVALLVPGGAITRYVIQIVFMGVILLSPMQVSNEVNGSIAYRNLEHSLQKTNPNASVALSWLIHAEPIYYSFGHFVGRLIY